MGEHICYKLHTKQVGGCLHDANYLIGTVSGVYSSDTHGISNTGSLYQDPKTESRSIKVEEVKELFPFP
jgi:hypothetical protein